MTEKYKNRLIELVEEIVMLRLVKGQEEIVAKEMAEQKINHLFGCILALKEI